MPTFQLGGRIDALDRPGQAVQDLLTGDVDGAWKAMLSPESLGPLERDALLNKWGIKKDSFQGRMLDVLTNPGVLLSVALTYAIPIPTAQNLFKVKEGIDGMLSRIPLLRSLSSSRAAFAGTKVPEVLDTILANKNFLRDEGLGGIIGPAVHKFEQNAGRAMNVREQLDLFNYAAALHRTELPGWEGVGSLFPNLEGQVSPAVKEVSGEIRRALNATNETMWGNVENLKLARNAVQRMKDTGFPDEDMEGLLSYLTKGIENGGYKGLPDYMPRRVVPTEADIKMLRDATIATAGDQEFQRGAQYKIMNFLGREFFERKNAMIPNLQQLMLMGDRVDQAALLRLHGAVKDRLMEGFEAEGLSSASMKALERRSYSDIMTRGKSLVGEGDVDKFVKAIAENHPKQYDMLAIPVLEQYYHSISSTYALTVKGGGPALLGELQTMKLLGKGDARAAWRANVLENTVIPSVIGRPSPRQLINANLWDQRVGEIIANFDRPSVRNLVGNKFSNWAMETWQANHSAFSLRGMVHQASSYFYTTTLSVNPAAAFRNLFQGVNTYAQVGMDNTLAGYKRAWEGASTYAEARLTRGLAHADALAEAYPEFASARLAGSPVTDEALGRALDSAYRIQRTAPAGISMWQKAQRVGMSMFSGTETVNRLGGFYAGLSHAEASGLAGAEAIEHARKVVTRGQFVSTLTDQPIAFLPSGGFMSNPLVRQFMQFPLRTLEFVIEPIRHSGTLLNPHTMRLLSAAYITSEIGDVLGVNVGDALIGGALPTFTNVDEKGHVLAPLPIVPPVIALGAGLLSGIGSGSWETTRRQLPLLVPGGVGLSRMIGMIPAGPSTVPQDTARWLGKKYADYQNTNPLTGRIPVYSGGGSLTGYYKPWEIIRYGLGIKGGEIDQESEIAQRLTKDSDLMKQTRHEYTEALFANDPRKAAGIEAGYEERFGHKIALTQQQIVQMQQRRSMTRIERELAALPREARPSYEAAIAGEGLGQTISPDQRKPLVGVPPNYTNDLGLLDTLDPYSIGRYRNNPIATGP